MYFLAKGSNLGFDFVFLPLDFHQDFVKEAGILGLSHIVGEFGSCKVKSFLTFVELNVTIEMHQTSNYLIGLSSTQSSPLVTYNYLTGLSSMQSSPSDAKTKIAKP